MKYSWQGTEKHDRQTKMSGGNEVETVNLDGKVQDRIQQRDGRVGQFAGTSNIKFEFPGGVLNWWHGGDEAR